ncbi:MAG: fibrinogen-like YCDxxxxGGGW domain-containing protein, partial [Myxococcota bacterium]|nr:fibrinogen-like YCDxxxxGGGW domain-containing protein [Myxococcota bacterium]
AVDLTFRVDFPWREVAFHLENTETSDHVVSWMAQTPGDCHTLDPAPGEALVEWTLPACNAGDDPEWLLDDTYHGVSLDTDTHRLVVDQLMGNGDQAFTLTLKANTCGDGIIDHDTGEECDDGYFVPNDGCSWNCELEADGFVTDCAAIHAQVPATPSGLYDIYPDGDEASKVTVWCDMETDGGGWTQIFLAASDDLHDTQLSYDVDSLALREASDEVMIGFADDWTTRARFAMPEAWETQAPMAYKKENRTIDVWINDAVEPVSATLRFGHGHYLVINCDKGWMDVSSNTGRICISGTAGPYWTHFADSGSDRCNTSTQGWNTTPCSEDRRFAIMVRRPICGNGQVELGEECDGGGGDSTGGCTTTCQAYDATASQDCVAIRDALAGPSSGMYSIDPDGDPSTDPITVYCDMETDGGGWTRLFLAEQDNYDTDALDYAVTAPELRATTSNAMIAYMPSGGGPLADRARFLMPQDWVDQAPLSWPGEDTTVSVHV